MAKVYIDKKGRRMMPTEEGMLYAKAAHTRSMFGKQQGGKYSKPMSKTDAGFDYMGNVKPSDIGLTNARKNAGKSAQVLKKGR